MVHKQEGELLLRTQWKEWMCEMNNNNNNDKNKM